MHFHKKHQVLRYLLFMLETSSFCLSEVVSLQERVWIHRALGSSVIRWSSGEITVWICSLKDVIQYFSSGFEIQKCTNRTELVGFSYKRSASSARLQFRTPSSTNSLCWVLHCRIQGSKWWDFLACWLRHPLGVGTLFGFERCCRKERIGSRWPTF